MKTKYILLLVAALSDATAARGDMSQQAYIKASNTDMFDQFGFALALAGDTLVVGANIEASSATGINGDQTDNSDPNAGAAYVFVRDGTNWTQQAYLKASNTESGDNFAYVAADGDTIVVGASREASGATGVNGDESDNSVANSGAAYVFVRNGTNWTQQAYLKASNTGADYRFGVPSISGDTIAIGSVNEASNATGVNGNQTNINAPKSGAVYIFVRSGTNWTQQAYIKASNSQSNDFFGFSVGLSGDTLVVGAYGEDSNGDPNNDTKSGSGAAYVFVRNGTNWTQQAYLKASNTAVNDIFGYSVAISGDTILVGAPDESSGLVRTNGNGAGAAYVFVRNGTNWTQQAFLKASNRGTGDGFGVSVSISGDIAVAGALTEFGGGTGVNPDGADNTVYNAGAAYVFVRNGTNWSQQAYLKPSNTSDHFDFGGAVAVSGETVVSSAFGDRSRDTGVNGSQNDDGWSSAGAAYVFTGFSPPPPLSITQSNANIRVSWPGSAAGFTLEQADALDGNWLEIPPPYQTNSAQTFITLAPSPGKKFYRLRR